MKTIDYQELDFVVLWKCPNCKKMAEESAEVAEDLNCRLTCNHCKKKTKVLEPEY